MALLLAAAAPARLPPVEQCTGDPAFDRTRKQVERVVQERDFDGLLALISDDIRFSFGGGFGKDGFRRYWSARENDPAVLWKEIAEALKLGCAAAVDGEGKEYRAFPAMFVTGDGYDGYSTWVSLPGSVLRSQPNGKGAVVSRLPAWTVLDEVEHHGGDWIEAHTPNGRRGYIATAQARSLLDYRIIFGRRTGEWRITAFVAGD